jgi:hypothetical protein
VSSYAVGGANKPIVTRTAPPPVELISEHGAGGGYTPGDTGYVPTEQMTGTDTQEGTGYPDSQPSDYSAPSSPYSATTSGSSAYTGPIDWAQLLGQYGLPGDIVAELDKIFRQTGDVNQAIAIGTAYIRGTSWYAATYPGIQQGINAGLFNDERGYRAYSSDVQQIYQQYYGRSATSAEISQYIIQGQSANRVAAGFQAEAIKGNLSDPLKALFSSEELTALSNQQAGIDSALGQRVLAQANLYTQVAPLYQNFYGRAPSKDEIAQLATSGTDAKTIAQQFATQEAINAMNPAIRDLFTPEEIRQVALDAAGGITANGAQLKNLMDLAAQLNPIYHQYTGQGVARSEVEQTYNQGTPVDTIAKQFSGAAYIAANQNDIQRASGSFGDTGLLSAQELKALGEEQAGLDSPLGQLIGARLQKAQERMQGAFKGVLAHPALQFSNGRLAGQAPRPDVGA